MLRRLFGLGKDEPVDAPIGGARTVLLEDIARPFPEPTPCGSDITYDTDFIRLKDEFDKLSGVGPDGAQANNGPGRASFDGDLIISLAHGLLRDRSKDLRTASYLAFGLARRDGLSGVAEGIAALRILVDGFWDGLFPPLSRMKGRMNAIESCLGWLTEAVERERAAPGGRDLLERASKDVAHLQSLAAGWEQERVVSRVTSLARALTDALAAQERAAEVVKVPERIVTANGSSTANIASTGATTTSPSTHPSFGSTPLDDVLRSAAALLLEDARRILPYRLTRACRWDVLTGEPPNERNKTRIEAPPIKRREYLERLRDDREWTKLLEAAESSFTQQPFHFWLDLQRYTIDALEALGADFEPARDAVVREVQGLLTRLPRMAVLGFADGTPFAGASTAVWLEQLTRRSPSASTPRASKVAAESDRFADAKKRLTGGDFGGALALLQRASSEDVTRRQHFLRRSYMASICLDAGQLAIARAVFEELSESIELHRLEQWEPDLALAVWTRQHACYSTLATRAGRNSDNAEIVDSMERVFARICRVDSTRALTIAQEVRRPA
ncbi:MAG: type VI secretion system protein TssA [Gemmatimonadaceae bacterium]